MDEKLYTRALKFLAKRPRSEKEVRDNLAKKKADPAQVDLIIAHLKQQKFLNDTDFALWWIEQRSILSPKGWRGLWVELKQKGISDEIVKEIESKYKNRELGEKSEFDTAKELAEKRFKKYEGLPKEEIYRKLGGFLARRGFDLDTIKAVIDLFLRK